MRVSKVGFSEVEYRLKLPSISGMLLFSIIITAVLLSVAPLLPRVLADGGTSSIQQSAVSQSTNSPFQGLTCSSCSGPPLDTEIAVGTYYVIETMVGWLNVYVKSSHALFAHFDNLGTLFGVPTSEVCGGDSRILFDTQAGAWFAAFLHGQPGTACGGAINVAIAVCTCIDPLSPWKVYQIAETAGPSGGNFPDHPEIAVTSDKLTITANMVDNAGNPAYWVIRKSDLVAYGNYVLESGPDASMASSGFSCGLHLQITPIRANNPSTPMYLVCLVLDSITGKYIPQLFSIDGLPPTSVTGPTLVKVLPEIKEPPPSAYEPNGGAVNPLISTAAWDRSQDAYMSQGNVWYAVDDDCNVGNSCIHLTKVDVTTSPSTIRQDFDWSIDGKGVYLPRVIIDSQGDLGLIFGYSSNSTYPSLGITGQVLGDSSLVQYVTIAAGSSYDPIRLQDYFGVASDPSDQTLLWAAGGYWPSTYPSKNWATMISSFRVVGLALSASPRVLELNSGSLASTSVKVQARGGFSGAVTLSTLTTPTGGPSASISPASLHVNLGQSNATTATVNASNVPSGSYYTLQVTATIPGLSLTLPAPIYVGPPLTCSASASPTSGSFSVTVQFTSSCTSGIPAYTYYWNFGDGSTLNGNAPNPQHTYQGPTCPPGQRCGQRFYPTLTVTDAFGYVVTPSVPSIWVWGTCTFSPDSLC